MAPLCGPHHVASSHDLPVDDHLDLAPCRWCSSALNKRSSLWPKNTSTYHRPPLSIRSDIFDEHIYRSDVDNSDNSDNGDNTTVVIGSVVGVVLLIAVLGIVICCCLASRKAKRCRRKKKKKYVCCKEKEKDKKKDKDKDKDKKKKDKDKKPYTGLASGTWQEVQDRIDHEMTQNGLMGPIAGFPPAHFVNQGYGNPIGPGNQMDAPQNYYGY